MVILDYYYIGKLKKVQHILFLNIHIFVLFPGLKIIVNCMYFMYLSFMNSHPTYFDDKSHFVFTEIFFPCKTGTTAKITPLAGNLLLTI